VANTSVIPPHDFENDIEQMSGDLGVELRLLFEVIQEDVEAILDEALQQGWSPDRILYEIDKKVQ